MPQAVLVPPDGRTAYVANFGSRSVTPISTATNKAGPAIGVGSEPYVLAMAPHHQVMYVVNYGSGTVTPVSTATGKAGRAVRVGTDPESIAFTANGGTAVVANEGSDNETKIDTATGASATAPVGNAPVSVLIEPQSGAWPPDPDEFQVAPWDITDCDDNNGASTSTTAPWTGFVDIGSLPDDFDWTIPKEFQEPPIGSGGKSPMGGLAGRHGALRRIPVGIEPGPMAFLPRNGTVYVVNEGSGNVTPLMLRSHQRH